ncbi:hypothetical protein HDV04_003874 [Boothiomyces sp. JEL0838]|nr:hypothetical protein HDV04_003874 [Boothiomyces sp. JEL0838]
MYKFLLFAVALGQLVCPTNEADRVPCSAKSQKSCLALGCCFSTGGNGPSCFQAISPNVLNSTTDAPKATTTVAVKSTTAAAPTTTTITQTTTLATTNFATATAAATSTPDSGISSGVTIGLIVIGAVIFFGAISLIYSKYAGNSIDSSALSIKPLSLMRREPKIDPSPAALPSFESEVKSEETMPVQSLTIQPVEQIRSSSASIAETPREMYGEYPNPLQTTHPEAPVSYPEGTVPQENPQVYENNAFAQPEQYVYDNAYNTPVYHPSGYIYDPNSNGFIDAQMGYGGFTGPTQGVYIPPTSTDPYLHRMSYMPPVDNRMSYMPPADPRMSYMPPADPRMSYMAPAEPRVAHIPSGDSLSGSETSSFANRTRNSYHPNFSNNQ